VQFQTFERQLGDMQMAFMGGIERSPKDTDPKPGQGECRGAGNFGVA
jgi:hypothetical protein